MKHKVINNYYGKKHKLTYIRYLEITNHKYKKQLIEMTRKKDIDQDALVLTQTKPKTKKPSMYKVLLLNDDFTPMEFVVHILERFFNIDHQQAVSIMLTIHQKGLAVVGVYPHEIAETKVAQVMEFSRKNQHPLQCTMEKE